MYPTGNVLVILSAAAALRLLDSLATASHPVAGIPPNLVRRESRSAGQDSNGSSSSAPSEALQALVLDTKGVAQAARTAPPKSLEEASSAVAALQDVLSSSLLQTASSAGASIGATAAAGAGVSVESESAVDTIAEEEKAAAAAAAADAAASLLSSEREEGALQALKEQSNTQRAMAAKSVRVAEAAREAADTAETAAGGAGDTAAVGNAALQQLDEVTKTLGRLREVANNQEADWRASTASDGGHNPSHRNRRQQHERQQRQSLGSSGGDSSADAAISVDSGSESEDPAAIQRKSALLLASAAPWRNAWQGLASGQKAKYSGRWKSRDGDFPVINDDTVTFQGGYTAKITYHGKNKVAIHMEDQMIEGKLSDGSLLWQDGDIWTRAENEAKLFAGRWKSKEGDFPVISGATVTFQAGYKGKIKYLSSTKLIAKVDGVATKGKLADGHIVWADGDIWERVPDEDKDIDVIFSGIVKMLSHVYKEAKDSLYGARARKPPPMAALIAQASKEKYEDEAEGENTKVAVTIPAEEPGGSRAVTKKRLTFSPYNGSAAAPEQLGKQKSRRAHGHQQDQHDVKAKRLSKKTEGGSTRV